MSIGGMICCHIVLYCFVLVYDWLSWCVVSRTLLLVRAYECSYEVLDQVQMSLDGGGFQEFSIDLNMEKPKQFIKQ